MKEAHILTMQIPLPASMDGVYTVYFQIVWYRKFVMAEMTVVVVSLKRPL